MSSAIITLFFFTHLLLFLLSFFLPVKYLKEQKWFQELGKKLVSVKEKQLRTNPVLKYFDKAVEQGTTGKARFIIFSLILLKCLGMVFIAVIGISLVIVPVQALMTATLFERIKLKGISQETLSRVMSFQLATMLTATVAGNLIGWRIFIDRMPLTDALESELYIIVIAGLAVLLTSWITATKEVRFYEANKTLIG